MSEHIHKFVIPVAWKPTLFMRTLSGKDYTKPLEYEVTKLRCECGEGMEIK